jgi:hypothetical protein
MSETKQTAVEQFAIALYEGGYLQGNGDEINDLLEHHKAMHRTEIIESYASGSNDRLKNTINTNYYNETYGGNK